MLLPCSLLSDALSNEGSLESPQSVSVTVGNDMIRVYCVVGKLSSEVIALSIISKMLRNYCNSELYLYM